MGLKHLILVPALLAAFATTGCSLHPRGQGLDSSYVDMPGGYKTTPFVYDFSLRYSAGVLAGDFRLLRFGEITVADGKPNFDYSHYNPNDISLEIASKKADTNGDRFISGEEAVNLAFRLSIAGEQ